MDLLEWIAFSVVPFALVWYLLDVLARPPMFPYLPPGEQPSDRYPKPTPKGDDDEDAYDGTERTDGRNL